MTKIKYANFLAIQISLFFMTLPVLAQNGGKKIANGSYVSDEVVPWVLDVDLRELPAAPVWKPGDPIEVVPEGVASDGPVEKIQNWFDPALQTVESSTIGEFLLAFEAHPPGNSSPPDTVGTVGPNHYISMVNASRFAIWDKSGNNLVPPVSVNSLWSGGASPCEDGDGDPIVVYDTLADRWVLQEFESTGNNFCIYVSQGPNPVSDGWFAYAFSAPNFPDYPQYGVWPDAYYVSTFEFPDLGIYAFDRVAMLAGQPATFQRFTVPALTGSSPRVTRIVPADFDGTILPPFTNQPNVFMRSVHSTQDSTNPVTRLELYEYAVDWATPSNSTFTLTESIQPAPFALVPCSPSVRDCIPQPGTSNKIDALFNRSMRQLHYRATNNNTESMVINQVVDAGNGVAGIRWWEIFRDSTVEGPGSNWTLKQDSTYSPNSTSRFMGAMAINDQGDIALGFSASSETETPSIRVTARKGTDPLNQMTMSEMTLVEGAGILTSNQRWGDYTSMDVDPSDEKVFWYINQRLNGTNQRSVWVGAFRLTNFGIFSDGFE
jgi:hypothetical protein